MSKHVREWITGAIKFGIGIGLLAYIISINWNNKPNGAPGIRQLLLGPIQYDFLLITAVLMALTLSLQLFRWYLLVRAIDLPFTIRNAFRLGLVGYFYSMFLPSSIGGDLVKAFVIAKEQPGRRAAAVATVIIDRAMGLFGLLLFASVTGSVAWAMGNASIENSIALQRMIEFTAVLAGSMAGGYLLLGLLSAPRADHFAGLLKHIPKAGYALAEAWYAVWMYRQRMKVVIFGVAVTAVAHICFVSAFYFASRAFASDDQATFPEIMIIAPIGFIIQAVPLSPGGVGVAELAFAELYKWCGRSESAGLIARLALRLVEWGLGFIGYLVYLRMKKELPIEALEAAKEESAHGGHLVDPPMGDETP